MKPDYFKTLCAALVCLFTVIFYQRTQAVGSTAFAALQNDTARTQKAGRPKAGLQIKKNEKEDGVDEDIKARYRQEFLQKRDPKLNRVPVERLLIARVKRDQFLQNIKRRPQAAPLNQVKPGNAPTTPPTTIAGLQWQERGPTNVGGRTRALMYDQGDAANGYKRVFAGGVDGGLWVTADITATPVHWTKINDFFDNLAISCIAQNPVNAKEIYAGTGEGFLNVDAVQGLGVWKTSDGGATWAHLTSTVSFNFVTAILVDRNSSVYITGELSSGAGFGVDKSTDGGSTWSNVISASETGADLQLAANGDVYASSGAAGTTGHIFLSDFTVNGANTGNAGTWKNITPETTGVITPATTSWSRIKLATAPNDANVVYAFMQSSSSNDLGGVEEYNKSTNKWTVRTVPAEAFNNGQAWYSIAAAVDPNNENVLYAGSLDAERSINGGQTWTQYTHWDAPETASNYVHADHHAYVYFPGSSTRLMMGTDGGISYTVNANATPPSFVSKDNGYDVTQFYSVALHPTSYNYALAGAQDNGTEQFTSAGLGATAEATGGDGGIAFIDQTNGNIQITAYTNDAYSLSTDNGTTFNDLPGFGAGQFINPTDYDASTKNLYAGGSAGKYTRIANVLNPVYDSVSVSAFGGANVMAVTLSPITANRVYFGLDNGNVVRIDNAQTGTSRTGVVLKPNGGNNPATVSCITVDPTTEDHILVSYSNYGVPKIFETKNASAATPTWTEVTGNLPDMPVWWSMFYPGDPTKALIATELGVWTTDLINGSSTTWDPNNDGLANVEVRMLKYRSADKTIAAATHGRGLFTGNLTGPILSALATSTGTLSPAFSSSTLSYSESVPNATTSMTVTPTATSPTATITVNGKAVASGSASAAITLNAGANTINVVVTANSISQTYAITVNRAASNNANLSSIYLRVPFTPLTKVTGPDYLDYTASVANNIPSVEVQPYAAGAGATITVNGTTVASGAESSPVSLAEGAVTTITTVITAQDGVTKQTCIIKVTRAPSSNANLTSIWLRSPFTTLTKVTGPDYLDYTASVANSVATLQVQPTAADANAAITVNGTAVASGAMSAAIPLAEGAVTTITTVITAQDGTTKQTCVIKVTRAPSSNANLASIWLRVPFTTLTKVSGPDYLDYTASVTHNITSLEVQPTTSDPNATVTVNGTAVASGTESAPIALAVGSNKFTTIITAQDGTTKQTCIITVTRAASEANPFDQISVAAPTETPVLSDDGITVHRAVSPNGDGIEDFLQIDNISQYPDNHLVIMNRDGELIYETKGYDNNTKVFDGHNSKTGQMQLPGTYFFALDYTVNGTIKHKTGFLVLKY